MFAMPIALRLDYNADLCRLAAKRSKDGPQSRRLLALAAIFDGASRGEAARIGGVSVQIVRDWVLKFNAHGPAGLIDRKAPGPTSRLTTAHRAALAELIEAGPIPAIHGVVRWRLVDLCQWFWEEFRVKVAKQTLSRELRAMGYRKLSARPLHQAQDSGAIDVFKKTSQPALRKSRATKASPSTPWNSGSPTKPGSARRTRSRGAGPDGGHDPAPLTISAPPPPTSSERSARTTARAQHSSCPAAIPRR
jgi:transposase